MLSVPPNMRQDACSKHDRPTVSICLAIYLFNTTSLQTGIFTISRTQAKIFSKGALTNKLAKDIKGQFRGNRKKSNY